MIAQTKTARVRNYQPTEVDGEKFHSKKEARRWSELKLLERAGQISDLKRQVRVSLRGERGPILTKTGRTMVYVADFTYNDKTLGFVIEDAKGWATDVYLLKKAILKAQGVEIVET
ncbi:MAG: DUF1064 domain-containing protein [Hyphomicrobiales bacterium]|nr:DUF1064 domain-containing protein [Hyphomicrobiales bacterium]